MQNDSFRPDVGDQNVERLIEASYKPEAPDPAFVQQLQEKLCAAARTLSGGRQSPERVPLRPSGSGRRLRWALGLAASLAVAAAAWYLWLRDPRPTDNGPPAPAPDVRYALPGNLRVGEATMGLTARARAEAPKITPVRVGEWLTTKPGERRRVTLEDGSVVYLNHNTQAQYVADRQLALNTGEVYVEVAPRQAGSDSATFVVKTTARTFSAHGTRFAVNTDAKNAGVVVTQGQVKVSDVAEAVHAGQQLVPGSGNITPAPRASHQLDWTRELMAAAESPLVPCSKHAGGALIAVDPHGQEMRLTLRKYKIDVHVEDGFARTTIDQTYFNNEWARLEGVFYFPLPPDATLSRLAMYVEDGNTAKLMEGGMAERDHARQVFETIMHTQRDPALLEWVDGSTFKMRVFPLEGRKEKRIILSYTQKLSSLYGATHYRFPAGHNMELVRDWEFAARVKQGEKLRVTSESHPAMRIAPNKSGDMELSLRENNLKPHQDVTVEIYDSKEANLPDVALFSSYEHEDSVYLMLRYRPRLESALKRERRDWVILYEASANRDPLLARAQIDVIRTLLSNAEHDDTFTLFTAGTRVHTFAKESRNATADNIAAAVKYLEGTHLIGAMDVGNALAALAPVLKTAKNPHLLHVGAGIAAIGERREDTLAKLLPDGARYVGVGVGKRWSRSFMKMAAERTGGCFTQINPDEPIAWRAFELLSTLNTPRLMELRVVDNAEKVTFLSDAQSLAQGEEVCAVARVTAKNGEKVPETVTVSGKVAGQPFVRELPVRGLVRNAAYLPRQWAKLEIDRLMAEDAEKNKKRITELSMASYVMSPYTSLLVLETEADYQRFNVDRGRKDHWAMYQCEERIPIVFEPPANQVQAPKPQEKRPAHEVLQSVLIRVPPQFLSTPSRPNTNTPSVNGWTWYYGTYAMSMHGDKDGEKAGDKLKDRDPDILLRKRVREQLEVMTELDAGLFDRRDSFSRVTSTIGQTDRSKEAMSRPFPEQRLGFGPHRLPPLERGEIAGWEQGLRWGLDASSGSFGPGLRREVDFGGPGFGGFGGGRGPRGFPKTVDPVARGGGQEWRLPGTIEPRTESRIPIRDGLINLDKGEGDRKRESDDLWTLEAMTARLLQGHGMQRSLLYERPTFSGDNRIWGDLASYAPGLNTSLSDIRAVLEAEAKADKSTAPGTIDEAARKLIETARAAGWQTLSVPADGKQPAYKVHFNGSGQFAYDRIHTNGLRESVLCDGTTLWHLYPEIGLGARRPVSRFHRADFAELVPWVLPPAEDLARGIDVKSLNDTSIALVPRGAESAKDDQGKPISYLQVQLRFAAAGQLAERQYIEMPAKKTLYRETYEDGVVKLHNVADNKIVSEQKLALAEGQAPSLKPKTDKYVVLTMPLRTREHTWTTRIAPKWNGSFREVDEEAAIALLAADCSQHNGGTALQVFGERFHAKGDRRIGFYVLLAGSGIGINPAQRHQWNNQHDPIMFDVAAEHPDSPLALYLAFHHDIHQKGGKITELGDIGGPKDGFVQRMATFRDLWLHWHVGRSQRGTAAEQKADRQRALAFVKESGSPLFAWAMLDTVRGGGEDDFRIAIAEAYRTTGDAAGMHYTARYEHARGLLESNRHADARKLFAELYAETLKAGRLPPIDHDFRRAWQDRPENQEDWASLLRRTAGQFAKDKNYEAVLLLSWQAHQLGDHLLSNELFGMALAVPETDPERNRVALVGIDYLLQTNQFARADALLQTLLKDEKLSERASLWRLGAALASRRGMTGRAVGYLEKAMDLEFRHLPDIINLQTVRHDYGMLLGYYHQLAVAVTMLETEPSKDFLAKVVRAADRWRALDPDSTAACQTTARILQTVGAKDLAWDYLTTPIGQRPNEAAPWVSLAQLLRNEAEYDLADRAYVQAFESERTNAQILWDRAQNLQQAGKLAEAREVYRQIADPANNWQPRFQWMAQQARWQLHNR